MTTEDPRVLQYRLDTVNRMIDRALDCRDRKAFVKGARAADATADQARQDGHLVTQTSGQSDALCLDATAGYSLMQTVIGGMAMHVVPRNDLIEHTTTDACPCGPQDQSVIRDDGSVGWLTVHHSLDGRELTESGGRHVSG